MSTRRKAAVLAALFAALWVLPVTVSAQPRGPRGPGRGPGPGQRADMQVFHYLLDHRKDITRKVKNLPEGVETLTESDKPEVAKKLREHVEAMHKRLKEGRPIHMRDPLFREIFRNADKIKMTVKETDKGVQVTETSKDPYVARLIQSHAEVLNQFLARGHEEVRKDHTPPPRPKP